MVYSVYFFKLYRGLSNGVTEYLHRYGIKKNVYNLYIHGRCITSYYSTAFIQSSLHDFLEEDGLSCIINVIAH